MHTGRSPPTLLYDLSAFQDGGLRSQIESISHPSKHPLFPLFHLGRSLALTPFWGAFFGHGSVTTHSTKRGQPQPQEGTPSPWAQSILVGSFSRCLASRTILARERRMGTAIGRKSGM